MSACRRCEDLGQECASCCIARLTEERDTARTAVDLGVALLLAAGASRSAQRLNLRRTWLDLDLADAPAYPLICCIEGCPSVGTEIGADGATLYCARHWREATTEGQ